MRSIDERATTVGVWLSKPDDDMENELAAKKMAEFNQILHDIVGVGDVFAVGESTVNEYTQFLSISKNPKIIVTKSLLPGLLLTV